MMAALSRSSSVHSIPACATASRAAMTENCAKRSMKLSVLRGKYVSGVIAEHGGAVLETDLTHAHFGNGADVFWNGPDSGSTTGKCLPEPFLVKAQSADDAHS